MSRRALLKGIGAAPLLFRPAPFSASTGFFYAAPALTSIDITEARYTPSYPARSPLEDVLRRVRPGSDEFLLEAPAFEINQVLSRWSHTLRTGGWSDLRDDVQPGVAFTSFTPAHQTSLRSSALIQTLRCTFGGSPLSGIAPLLASLEEWTGSATRILTAEFEITAITALEHSEMETEVRYSVVTEAGTQREQRVGTWLMQWARASGIWQVKHWQPVSEERGKLRGPGFQDITEKAFQTASSYREQMLRGSD